MWNINDRKILYFSDFNFEVETWFANHFEKNINLTYLDLKLLCKESLGSMNTYPGFALVIWILDTIVEDGLDISHDFVFVDFIELIADDVWKGKISWNGILLWKITKLSTKWNLLSWHILWLKSCGKIQHDFSITQILRDINLENVKVQKMPFLQS